MSRARAIALAYFLSGTAGLIYEVAWIRLLTLQAGHTAGAVSTVLAAFMGGLAGGAALGAKATERRSATTCLRLYAGLELLIAVTALLLPATLRLATPLLATAYADGAGATWFGIVRLFVTLVALLPPTMLMGATYPFAVAAAERRAAHDSASAAGLYAVNTLGAALGSAAAGFVLIPGLGIFRTTLVAVALNLAAAVVAWTIARRITEPEQAPTAPQRGRHPDTRVKAGARRPPPTEAPSLPLTTVAAVLAVSGATALAYEVVWTRLLSLALGPTTYAFALMLSVFITGIGLGAGVGTWVARRSRQPVLLLALAQALAALGALGAFHWLDRAVLTVATTVATRGTTFGSLLTDQSVMAGLMMLPMTLALGAAFPLGLAAGGRDVAQHKTAPGFLYAANTVGAIVGSLVAGFVAMPWLGAQRTLLVAGSAGAAVAIALVATRGGPPLLRAAGAGVALLALAIGWTGAPVNRSLISSGGYKYAARLGQVELQTLLEAGTLLYYGDGAGATVSVRRLAGTTSLAIDGKVDASNGGDMLTQKMLAHLPLLLHERPRRVAIIGLGSGVTAGAALVHPVEAVDTLEISREVVEASRFFEAENLGALWDPRLRLIAGDGRTHLMLGRGRYDVIVSEPSNPWMAGIASLFTREFFEAARSRLAPGGLLCQWAHTYDISRDDLRSIVGTFASVFPNGSMWLVGEGDLLLIGGDEPLDSRIARLESFAGRAAVRSDLARVGVGTRFSLVSMHLGGRQLLEAFAGDALVQTDDRSALEFSAPKALYGPREADLVDLLRRLSRSSIPQPAIVAEESKASAADWLDRATMLKRTEAWALAHEAFGRVLAIDPSSAGAVEGLLETSVPLGLLGQAEARLRQLVADDPGAVAARVGLSRALAASGRLDEAVAFAREAIELDPGNPTAWEQLASVASDASQPDALADVVAELERRFPDRSLTAYYAASLAFLRDDPQTAARLAGAAIARQPGLARAHNLKGAALATMGQVEPARQSFAQALIHEPRDATTYANLARLEAETGRLAEARSLYAEALTVDPASAELRRELGLVIERLNAR